MVNGYGATFGWARESTPSKLLLPALGYPIKPTSAMVLSSSDKVIDSPSCPGSFLGPYTTATATKMSIVYAIEKWGSR